MQGRNLWIRDGRLPIVERKQATGKVGPGIAFQFEHHRFWAAFEPDFAAHNSFHAIVNVAADHAVVNAKSHAANSGTPPLDCKHSRFMCRGKRQGGRDKSG
jgi:hypothetical protein